MEPNEQDMMEYDQQCQKADHDTYHQVHNAVYRDLKDGDIGVFEERAIGVAKDIDQKNMHPEFAGWCNGLDTCYPDHRGIIDAGEHYLYNCQEP
ncbi:hypothetical protein GF389_03610 [Candidatus Dojkabacteria bacterium]|nr:hypothetical protein [Candidatus Dojkabacteria bacterium]